ncbi:hypothetical protein PIB30_081136 [Stylosanthes scabra]|uniref:Uncharacterized protein n=1 Tax=Stylosanthes scabra TaxID=79078 RepID=A0ABU6XR53_9FABA|nr:hypothetical protein [Stylosanthes scabra]
MPRHGPNVAPKRGPNVTQQNTGASSAASHVWTKFQTLPKRGLPSSPRPCHAQNGKMEKGSLRSKKRRFESILDRASTLRRGAQRLGVPSHTSGLSNPRLGVAYQPSRIPRTLKANT